MRRGSRTAVKRLKMSRQPSTPAETEAEASSAAHLAEIAERSLIGRSRRQPRQRTRALFSGDDGNIVCDLVEQFSVAPLSRSQFDAMRGQVAA